MDPPISPSPTPGSPPPNQEDDFLRSSSEEELAQSRVRRKSVHYATIGEFLASLRNVQDKAVCLEDYLGAVRCSEKDATGDGEPVKERPEQAKD